MNRDVLRNALGRTGSVPSVRRRERRGWAASWAAVAAGAWGGVLLAAGLSLAAPGAARAEDDPYSRSGCYVGVGGGLAFPTDLEGSLKGPYFEQLSRLDLLNSVRPSLTFLDAEEDDSLVIHGRAGCRDRWLGGELHFEWLDGFEAEVGNADVGRRKAELQGWAATADAKLYPFTGRIQPYATAGFGYMRIEGDLSKGLDPSGLCSGTSPTCTFDFDDLDVDDWDFVVRAGAGLELYVTQSVALNVDATYLIPTSSRLSEFDYLSVSGGLLFRF